MFSELLLKVLVLELDVEYRSAFDNFNVFLFCNV